MASTKVNQMPQSTTTRAKAAISRGAAISRALSSRDAASNSKSGFVAVRVEGKR